MPSYICKRCGYTTDRKSTLQTHLQKQSECRIKHHDKPCEQLLQELKDKRYLDRRCDKCLVLFAEFNGTVYHCRENVCSRSEEYPIVLEKPVEQVSCCTNPEKQRGSVMKACNTTSNKKYVDANMFLTNTLQVPIKEKIYQTLIESIVDGKQQHLQCGITDITSDEMHVEIKEWDAWKSGIGQLLSYNDNLPRDHLFMFLFGRCDEDKKSVVAKTAWRIGKIECFDLQFEDCALVIKRLLTLSDTDYTHDRNTTMDDTIENISSSIVEKLTTT